MMIWVAMAGLTALVIGALVLPVLRGAPQGAARPEFDAVIYRDQLAELDRDAARGIIGPAEAGAARNEVSRRLLGAIEAEGKKTTTQGRNWRPALVAALAVPAIALPIYLWAGSPHIPDLPLQMRLAHAVENDDIEALVAQVESHLAQNPGDLNGWQVLAPIYRRMERYDDAANAYAKILTLTAPTGALLSDYAEMLVYSNQGLVSATAAHVFAEALKLDPANPKARFFAGLALNQEGKRDEALAAWTKLLADSPADATWRPMLEREIANLRAPASGPTADQVAAAQNMSAADRDTMIRGMVDGLEAKLKTNGDDLEGWRRLINARLVLGERDKAKASLDAARQSLKDKPEALASLDSLAKELGIE
jgi:cytochrome c-type biogenesis protein CcmH